MNGSMYHGRRISVFEYSKEIERLFVVAGCVGATLATYCATLSRCCTGSVVSCVASCVCSVALDAVVAAARVIGDVFETAPGIANAAAGDAAIVIGFAL